MAFSDDELLFEILKGKELVGSVEIFVVLTVTALHFAVVPGRIGFNQLVADTEVLQSLFKERGFVVLGADEAVSKFGAVVRLDALYGIWKAFNATLDKLR